MIVHVVYNGVTRSITCEAGWTLTDLLVASVVAFGISRTSITTRAWSTLAFFGEDGIEAQVMHGRPVENWMKQGERVALRPTIIK